MVLCVAAVVTVTFQRLRQPVVLGYILAGFIIGPHLPGPFVADSSVVNTLSELGVILLMFSLGLEFSFRKLIQVGPTAGVTAIIQCSIMIWLGYVAGRSFGWTPMESFFAGSILAISSTTIIAKAFDEQGIKGKLREMVVGILIVEDLIAILLMATLTAVATGSGLSASALAITTGKLAGFLIGLVGIGMLIVPRSIRYLNRLNSPETTLVASIGICFGVALLAQEFGYSVALGAFLAGSLIAESGEEKTVEHLVEPVRDMFAAIFFVSVGMLIDPALIWEHRLAVVVLTLLVVVGKIVGVSFGAFLSGNGVRTSIQSGMSLAQIGEFSFIIASLGLTLNATREFIYPVAVSVSVLTTLFTPWLIRGSGSVSNFVDRILPGPLQTFTALYGSWVEQLSAPQRKTSGSNIRRHVRFLVIDAASLAAIIIAASLSRATVTRFAVDSLGAGEQLAGWFAPGAAVLLAIPFLAGLIRVARGLGVALAERSLPGTGKVDPNAAPQRALVVTLQLAIVLLIGSPLVALTQPFLPDFSAAALLIVLGVLAVSLWRSATNLQGHVRNGAQVIIEAIASQSRASTPEVTEHALDHVRHLLPGLGDPVAVQLEPESAAVGKTLAEVNLRGLTGATVLAITRGEESISLPSAKEVLYADDILALAGTHEAVEAASLLLATSDEAEAELALQDSKSGTTA